MPPFCFTAKRFSTHRTDTRQTQKTVGATKTKYVYSGSHMLEEYDGTTGNLLTRYVYGGADEVVLQMNAAGTITYLHDDHLGSIIAQSNTIGVPGNKYNYSPYGEANLTGTTFGYTAQRWDSEIGGGLYHYKARYYHPGLGRFLQPDPVGYGAGMNLYAYVGNDPLDHTDPDGLESIMSSEHSRVNPLLQAGFEFSEGAKQAVKGNYTPDGPFSGAYIAGQHVGQYSGYAKSVGRVVLKGAASVVVGSYNALKSLKVSDKHHIIQWKAVDRIPGVGSYGKQPAIKLQGPSTDASTPHGKATQYLNNTNLGGTYGQESQASYNALRKAGLSSEQAGNAILHADSYYMGKLGFTRETVTQIPGNRN